MVYKGQNQGEIFKKWTQNDILKTKTKKKTLFEEGEFVFNIWNMLVVNETLLHVQMISI